MSPYEEGLKRDQARLRAALDKPLPVTKEDLGVEEFFNPWQDLMEGMVGPYDSDIEDLALDVLRAVRDRTTFTLLNDPQRGLAAQMFMHMLAVWLCDYGTSPRGVFPVFREMWDELIAKWEAYAKIAWADD